MALTNLAVFGGAFFTPILVGKITHTINWPWTFYLVGIFCTACLPAIIFFAPETAYRRSAYLNTDMIASDENSSHGKHVEPGHEFNELSGEISSHGTHAISRDPEETNHTSELSNQGPALIDEQLGGTAPKTGFYQSLKLFNGRKTDESFWKLLFRPFPLFAHPAVLWACLIQGALIGWTVFIGIILAAIFLGPPLFWNEVDTGYAYTGAFIGAILGFIVAGALADWSAKFMTQRNGGIYEPEFRIVLVIPQLIFGCAGLYGFGITAASLGKYSYIWPIFFFGLEVMGMVIGAVASALYIVDAHREKLPPTESGK
jgi:MFS family permease